MSYKMATGNLPLLMFSFCLCIYLSTGIEDDEVCAKSPAKMDNAWLTVLYTVDDHTQAYGNLSLWNQIEACYKCSLMSTLEGFMPHNKNCTVQLDSRFRQHLVIKHHINSTTEMVVYDLHKSFSQYGDYGLYVSTNGKSLTFTLVQDNDVTDEFVPIYVAMAIFAVLAIFVYVIKYLHREKYLQRAIAMLVPSERMVNAGILQDLGNTEDTSTVDKSTGTGKKRLTSLDTFRGFALTIMIFVNYGGGGYWFLDHSYWNGLTVADLVFPWFTWIIGTAIALAFRGQVSRDVSKKRMAGKVIIRTITLFMLGIAMESSNGDDYVDLSKLRVPGVLQRLAVSYGVVALFQVFYAKTILEDKYRHRPWSPVRDIVIFWPEWLFQLTLLVIHLALTFGLSVPGCPKGYIGPGGKLQDNGTYINCTGGAAGYIDRKIFGEQHIYQTPTCDEVYQTTMPYDPEGTLGTLTSIFMCFLGLQAGKILLFYDNWVSRIKRWLSWGVVCGAIAGVLCKFSQNGGWIPVNKNLWSVSFVLSLSSFAFILLTAMYLLIDVYGLWNGAPFKFPGMNSIVVYISHITFQHYFPIGWHVEETHASLLALHLWGVTVWVLMAMAMFYQGIFIAI